MTPENFIKAQLCLYAWNEGKAYGIDVMEGILLVLRNRHRAGWGDWLQLLKFDTHDLPDLHDHNFQLLLQKVDHIFDGTAPDKLTQGALYFGNLKETSDEFNRTIVQNMDDHPRCAVIGPIYFFR